MPGIRVRLDPSVTEAFPETEIRLVLALGLDNRERWDDVEEALSELERAVQRGEFTPLRETDAEILSWHEAYRAFGTNPRKFRPSLDALARRLARSGRLPRINPAVDAYNLISVTHGIPAGAFDAEGLDGDIVIRVSHPEDRFTPLGEPAVTETPHPGEIVYADGQRVLTRHWNYRDAESSKVTESTRHALFCLDRVSRGALSDDRARGAEDALCRLLRARAHTLQTRELDKAHAEAAFAW